MFRSEVEFNTELCGFDDCLSIRLFLPSLLLTLNNKEPLMKKIAIALGAVLMTSSLANAAISLTNEGFELGLSGWGCTEGAQVKGAETSPGPVAGNHFLLLSAVPGQPASIVSQMFSASEGDLLSGYARWLGGFGSASIVVLKDSGSTYIWSGYYPPSTDWTEWSWTVPKGGTYRLQYVLTGAPLSQAAFDAVPIPPALLLLASGLVSLAVIRRRKR